MMAYFHVSTRKFRTKYRLSDTSGPVSILCRYVEKTSAECNEDSYLAILHLSRVELHCKLQDKLHRVTWP
jgi:hypothetical protein